MKKLALITLATVALFSKSVTATKACEAYNDLKHNKNYGHIVLEPNSSYQILREQKSNYLIKIPNANPKTRWVSIGCFNQNGQNQKPSTGSKIKAFLGKVFSKKEPKQSADGGSLDSVLVLNWHNTFCETHGNRKECKRDGGEYKNHLVLHGLWPQPRNNLYCGIDSKIKYLDKSKRWNALPSLNLNSQVSNLLNQYMPGSKSNLQRHEYYKHGTCYDSDANRYFLDALTMVKEADQSIGDFLRQNVGKKIKLINLKRAAVKAFGDDIKYKIAIKCKGRVLNEIWISLKGKGNSIKPLLKGAKPIHSTCQEAIVDAPGKFRRF